MKSGFSTDVLSILRHNTLAHSDSRGLVLSKVVFEFLSEKKLLVSNERDELINDWDYIIVPSYKLTVGTLLKSLTELTDGGIIILQVTKKDKELKDLYKGSIGNLGFTKVFYDGRSYLVIHKGDEYGN